MLLDIPVQYGERNWKLYDDSEEAYDMIRKRQQDV